MEAISSAKCAKSADRMDGAIRTLRIGGPPGNKESTIEHRVKGRKGRGRVCCRPRPDGPPGIASRSGACPTQAAVRGSEARLSRPRRSEEHTSELQSRLHLVCRLL